MITPMVADALVDAEKVFGPQWIMEAIQIAAERNARNWRYIRAVLDDAKAKKKSPKLNNESKTKGTRNDAKPRPTSKPDAKQADPAAVAEINRRNSRKRGV